MKKFFPDKNASRSLKLLVIIAAVLILAAARFYIPVDKAVIIIGAILLTIVLFFDLIYIPLYFRSLRYESDGKSITRHGGVIMKSSKSVEFSAVQYTAAVSMPFSKHTGFNIAVLFVYGGQLRIPFLSKSDCDEILLLAGSARKESV